MVSLMKNGHRHRIIVCPIFNKTKYVSQLSQIDLKTMNI